MDSFVQNGVLASLYYDYQVTNDIEIYGGAGLSYSYVMTKIQKKNKKDDKFVNSDNITRNSFTMSAQASLGTSYQIKDSISVGTQYRFLYSVWFFFCMMIHFYGASQVIFFVRSAVSLVRAIYAIGAGNDAHIDCG